MSRSYKKAIIKYAGDMSLKKKYNRSLRRNKVNLSNGNSYRKFHCRWDLWDCRSCLAWDTPLKVHHAVYGTITKKLFIQKDINQSVKVWK